MHGGFARRSNGSLPKPCVYLQHSVIFISTVLQNKLRFFLPSVSVSIRHYETVLNVPAPINQVKFLVHLLYPTWQFRGLLFLLHSAQIQIISLHLNSNMPAKKKRCLHAYFHSYFGLNDVTYKAVRVFHFD